VEHNRGQQQGTLSRFVSDDPALSFSHPCRRDCPSRDRIRRRRHRVRRVYNHGRHKRAGFQLCLSQQPGQSKGKKDPQSFRNVERAKGRQVADRAVCA
jgi:hypothetical protein